MFIFTDAKTRLQWGNGFIDVIVAFGGACLAWHGWLHVKSGLLGVDTGVAQPEEDHSAFGNRSAALFLGLVFMLLGGGAVFGGINHFLHLAGLIA